MCDSQCEVGVGGIPGEVFHSHKHTDLFVGVPIQPRLTFFSLTFFDIYALKWARRYTIISNEVRLYDKRTARVHYRTQWDSCKSWTIVPEHSFISWIAGWKRQNRLSVFSSCLFLLIYLSPLPHAGWWAGLISLRSRDHHAESTFFFFFLIHRTRKDNVVGKKWWYQ